MLSYQHDFHAGNVADVMKHITLIYLLDYLKKKENPIYFIDTHAGNGIYNIFSPHMQKNREFEKGIFQLLEAKTHNRFLTRYIATVGLFNDGNFKNYPGSPAIALTLLDANDRVHLVEKHPTVARSLIGNLKKQKNIKIFQGDYEDIIMSVLPPKERRGLVFIDPSYEIKKDYESIPQTIRAAYSKFQTGMFAIWYPLKDPQRVSFLIDLFKSLFECNILRLEYSFKSHALENEMYGTGMIILNPPYTLEHDSCEYLNELVKLLNFTNGEYIVDWLHKSGGR